MKVLLVWLFWFLLCFLIMPTQCIVAGCKSQYGKHVPKEKAVSMHTFPADPNIKSQWIQIISAQNKKPSYVHRQHHRVCGLHFKADSFIDGQLRWRSVPTEFGIRYETSDDGWCAKPELVFKSLLKQSPNHDPNSDNTSRPNIEPDVNQTANHQILQQNSSHAAEHNPSPLVVFVDTLEDSSPAVSNTLEESVNVPDPLHQEEFSSPISAKDASDTFEDSSSPTVSNTLEETVNGPDPLHQQVFSSPIAAKGASATQSSGKVFYSPGEVASRLRETGRKRSIEDFTVEDFETPRKRARNLERIKEMARDKAQKLRCSRQIASRWKQRASSLKDVMRELQDKRIIMKMSKK